MAMAMAPLDRRTFEVLHPGRRTVFDLPLSDHESVSIAVLDSAMEWDEVACAAMLVPLGAGEDDWMYASEGGQWQLLATASVSRMIIVKRLREIGATRIGEIGAQDSGFERSRVSENAPCVHCEDEALKTKLRSVVVALAPRVCFRSGVPGVPFVDYTTNVVHRVVVEELYSSLTGLMVVEDVAVDDSDTEFLETESLEFPDDERTGETECVHRRGTEGRKLHRAPYRRRLRFKRMPNLIQTEVPLVVPHKLRNPRAMVSSNNGIDERSGAAHWEEVLHSSVIDHSFLVHKYLPPIVAGFVLAAACIEPCMERGEKAKVLALGVGGGALPTFLQKHLGFHVQAVDVDRVVLDAADRHFGLRNGAGLEVEVGDALQVVANLARKVEAEGAEKLGADATPKSMNASATPAPDTEDAPEDIAASNPSSTDRVTNGNKQGLKDHRVHVIVVDVDEGDARCGLSSPPSRFLEHSFLSAARTVLHDGGILAMNVVPNGAKSYCGVVSSLLTVFDDLYETAVQGDVNRVVFALPAKSAGWNGDGPLASLVKRFLDVRLITAIQRASSEG